MSIKILADFTGYGSAIAAILGGYLLVLLLATLVLLQFARACHILLKNRLTVSNDKLLSIWPAVVWGVMASLIILGPSFVYDFSTSQNFMHPQNIFRFCLGILAVVWWKRLGADDSFRIERFLILCWGVFTIAIESFTLLRVFAFSRVLQPDTREIYFMVVSFQRYFNTLTMLLVVLLIYSKTINSSVTNEGG